MNMTRSFAIIFLIALFINMITSKPIVSGKVIIALNCGSKDEVVESHDKVFKYQGVKVFLCRIKNMSVDNQYLSTTTPTMMLNKLIFRK